MNANRFLVLTTMLAILLGFVACSTPGRVPPIEQSTVITGTITSHEGQKTLPVVRTKDGEEYVINARGRVFRRGEHVTLRGHFVEVNAKEERRELKKRHGRDWVYAQVYGIQVNGGTMFILEDEK